MNKYYIGCGAIGLTAGFLVGGSASPVVQYALPLIFALVGGGAGILALTADPEDSKSIRRFKIAGTAATAVVVPFLFASIYSSLLRSGQSISVLLPTITDQSEDLLENDPRIKELSLNDLIQLAILNRDLLALPTPKKYHDSILERVIYDRVMEIRKFHKIKPSLISAARKLHSSLMKISSTPDNSDNSNLMKITLDVELFIASYNENMGYDNSFTINTQTIFLNTLQIPKIYLVKRTTYFYRNEI